MSTSWWQRQVMRRMARAATRPRTGGLRAEHLEDRVVPVINLFPNTPAVVGDVVYDEEVVVHGTVVLQVLPTSGAAGSVTFGPNARIRGNADGIPDSLTVNAPPLPLVPPLPGAVPPPVQPGRGPVTFRTPSSPMAVTVGGGGLQHFAVWAGPALTVEDFVRMDLPGDLTLATDQGLDKTWTTVTPIFKDQAAATTLTIGAAHLSAGNIRIQSAATTIKYAEVVVDEINFPETPFDPLLSKSVVAGGVSGPALTFTDNDDPDRPDTITRNTGSWEDDGFEIGSLIVITGAGTNDGQYLIDDLNATTIILGPADELNGTATHSAGVTVTQEVVDVNQVPLLPLDPRAAMPDGTELVFAAPNTITRLTGRWDQFTDPATGAATGAGFAVGDTLVVQDSDANDGVYRVEAISADGRTLTVGSGRSLDPVALEAPAVTGNPTLSFLDNGADADTIVRSAGSWLDDGFSAGLQVELTGAGANSKRFAVVDISADGLTLTLGPDDAVAPAAGVAGAGVVVVEPQAVVRRAVPPAPGVPPLTAAAVEDNLFKLVGVVSHLLDLLPIGARAVVSETTSELRITGATLTATGDIAVTSAAEALVSVSMPALILGFTFVQSDAVAVAEVTGATVEAGGRFDLMADVDHTMSSTAKVVTGFNKKYSVNLLTKSAKLIPGPALAGAFGQGQSTSEARVGVGTTVKAASVEVHAENLNTFVVGAVGKVNGIKTPNTGAAAAVIVSKTDSSATAAVDGSVQTTRGVAGMRVAGVTLDFDDNIFTPDTLTRETGSWTADGFLPGMWITVAGSDRNDGRYQIAGISPDGKTITFGPEVALFDEDTGIPFLGAAGTTVRADELNVQARSINVTNDASASAKVNPQPKKLGIFGKLGKLDSRLGFVKDQINGQVAKNPGAFVAAAAFTWAEGTNKADAHLGPTARVAAAGDLAVTAYAEEGFKTTASAGAVAKKDKDEGDGEGAKVGLAGGVAVTTYSNTADASIAPGAVAFASHRLEVDAKTVVPDQVLIDDDLRLLANLDIEAPPPPPPATDEVTKAKNAVDQANAYLGQVMAVPGVAKSYLIPKRLKKTVPAKILTTYTKATAGGNKLGASGSVNLNTVTNAATASVGAGARVNDPSAPAPFPGTPVAAAAAGQDVVVAASSDVVAVNYAGLAPPWIDLLIKKGKKGVKFTKGAKGVSGDVALGGTYQGLAYDTTATAYVAAGAVVRAARDVRVAADTRHLLVNLTQAGGSGKKVGITGGGMYVEVDNTSSASIHAGAAVLAGRDVAVAADHNLLAVNVAGASTKGGRAAVGAGVAVFDLANTVTATVGGSAGAGRDVAVEAATKQVLVSVGIAAAMAEGEEDETAENPDEPGLDGASLPNLFGEERSNASTARGGVGVAGSVALHFVSDTTHATITPGAVVSAAGAVGVRAKHDAVVVAVAGVVATESAEGNGGGGSIAGAVALSELTRDVRATVTGATVTGGTVAVEATTDEVVVTAAAGGAGGKRKDPNSTGKSVALIGSADVNLITSTTVAAVEGAAKVTSTGTGDITVRAAEDRLIVSVAGGLAYSGTAGVGAAADVTLVDNTVRASVAGDIDAGGDLFVLASADSDHISVAASVAVGTKGLGISGAASSINYTTDVRAYLADGATVDVAGSAVVDASDDLFAVQVGGAVGVGMGSKTSGGGGTIGAGIGASVAHAFNDRTVKAYVGNAADVQVLGQGAAVSDPSGTLSGRGLLVDASANDDRYMIGVAGSGGDKIAVAASVVVNLSDTDVQAFVGPDAQVNTGDNSAAAADQGVWVRAAHTSDVIGIGGGVAVASGSKSIGGVGAGADGQKLTSVVKAYVGNGADVVAKGDFVVRADGDVDQYDFAVGIGAAKKGFAGAASAVVVVFDGTTEATVGDNATVTAGGNVGVLAGSRFNPVAAAGAVAVGFGQGTSAFGASAVVVERDQTTRATIGAGAKVNAGGAGTALAGPDGVTASGVLVSADAKDTPVLVGLGAAGADNLAIAGSAVADDADVTVSASVGANAKVNTNTPGADARQAVRVRADYTTDTNAAAGGIALSKKAGIGAAAGVILSKRTVEATVGDGADVRAKSSVAVGANTTDDLLGIAAGFGGSLKVGIAGSAVVHTVTGSTRATVGDADITAPAVSVTSNADADLDLIAGAAGVGINAGGFGVSNTTLVRTDTVEALVGAGAEVTATNTLAVTATSTEDLLTLAVAAGGGGQAGVAASATVNVLTETTRAAVGANAGINRTNTGASPNQTVAVTASDTTTIFSLAGQLAGGGTVGAGAGADVGDVTKTTEAYLEAGSVTNALGGVAVGATSSEDITSVSASAGAAGTVAIAGGAAVYLLKPTTRARVGGPDANAAAATVTTGGSLSVTAADHTELDAIAGNLSGSGTASIGGGAGAVVGTKTTEAYIGANAVIDAKGVAGTAAAVTGFTAGYVSTAFSPNAALSGGTFDLGRPHGFETGDAVTYRANGGTPVIGLADGGTYSVIKIDATRFKLAATPDDAQNNVPLSPVALPNSGSKHTIARQGEVTAPPPGADLVDLDNDGTGDSPLDPSATAERTLTPTVRTLRGVAVSATSTDDIKTFGISAGGAGTAAVQISAAVLVLTNTTNAAIGSGAKVNQDAAGAHPDQSVVVSAASDLDHLNVAGAGSIAGTLAVTPGVGVVVADLTTTAAVGADAKVAAEGDVSVTATATEDILLIAASLAGAGTLGVAGSAGAVDLTAATSATVGEGATVRADGNVLVRASDLTDIDTIAGSVAVGGVAGAGAGVAVVLIDKSTDATVGKDAVVDALGGRPGSLTGYTGAGVSATQSVVGLVVQAVSREDLLTVAATGAAGGTVGFAGAVSVQVIDSDTAATIGKNAQVNQLGGANALQSVNVAAVNTLKTLTVDGAVGGSTVVGLAGGVDVSLIRNDTAASIGDNARVKAARDVGVYGLADKEIDTFAVGAGVMASGTGPGAAIGAGVVVLSVGGDLAASYSHDKNGDGAIGAGETTYAETNDEGGTAGEFADLSTATGGLSSLFGDYANTAQSDEDENTARLGGRFRSAGSALSAARSNGAASGLGATAPVSGTSAAVGAGAVVTAGRNVEVAAAEAVDAFVVAGGAGIAISLLGGGIGAGVAVVTLGGAVDASVGKGAELTATAGDITVRADREVDGVAFGVAGGAGGIFGLAGAVGIVTDTGATKAALADGMSDADGVKVLKADELVVRAESDAKVGVAAFGGAVSLGVSAGAAVARGTAGGTTEARVGDYAQVGQNAPTAVRAVSVAADAGAVVGSPRTVASPDLDYPVMALGVGLGAIAGAGTDAKATASVDAKAGIGTGADVRAAEDITVDSALDARADAEVGSGAGGGLAVGVALADATVSGSSRAAVGSGAVVRGRDISVTGRTAADAAGKTTAAAVGIGLGALTANRAAATITTDANDSSGAVAAGELIGRNILVSSTGTADADADALGVTAGLGVAIGMSFARATVTPDVDTAATGRITATGNLTVRTLFNEGEGGEPTGGDARADGNASGGGLLSGNGVDTRATYSPDLTTTLGGVGSSVTVGGTAAVVTRTYLDAEAESGAYGGGVVSIGAALADALAGATRTGNGYARNTVRAAVADGTVLSAGEVGVTAAARYTADTNVEASGGGIVSGNGSDGDAVGAPGVTATVGTATVTAAGLVSVSATAQGAVDVLAEGINAGGLAVGASLADATSAPGVTANAGGPGAVITADALSVLATAAVPTAAPTARARATGATGALIGVSATDGTARSTPAVSSTVGPRTTLAVADAVTVTATGNSSTRAEADSVTAGLIAAGSNAATAAAAGTTAATLGAGVQVDAGSPVGGLVDGGVYYAVVSGNAVRLATSFSNADAAVPVVINLSAPAVSGTPHHLDRLLQPAGSGPAFATSAVNAATDTITLPADHKLQTGMAVVYRRPVGPAVRVEAVGDDRVFAYSQAGSGGLVAGAAASADAFSNSNTTAQLANDDPADGTQTRVDALTLTVSADHTTRFDTQTDTIQASALGFSGSWGNSAVFNTVGARIGDGAKVTAGDVAVNAVSRSRKDLLGANEYNVKAGSGGVFQGNAAESRTTLTDTTTAALGAAAEVTTTPRPGTVGGVSVQAVSDVEGSDDVKLDTGGAIVGSGVTSHLVTTLSPTASVGAGAKVAAAGDVGLATRTRGVLRAEPQVHTYGLAAAAVVDGLGSVTANNTVSVAGSAQVEALGQLRLLAGRDLAGAQNQFDLTVHGDALNISAVPVDSLKSHGTVIQNQQVNVAAGAHLKGAKDALLVAERDGAVNIRAYGSGKSWISAVASGIDALAGSDGISEELKGGSSTATKSATVRVDGTVEVGIRKDRHLTIPVGFVADAKAGTPTGADASPGVTFSYSEESVVSNLREELAHWQNLYAEYRGDAAKEAAYQAEISRVQQRLNALGLATTANGATVYAGGYTAPYVTVDPIAAQSGTVFVQSDALTGGGLLKAPGNVSVTITNASPAYLRVRDVLIPNGAGGKVWLNGVDIATAPGRPAVQSGADAGPPQITITNTYKKGDPTNPAAYSQVKTSPDVELVGEVSETPAVLTVTSEGGVTVRGTVTVGAVNITAGGDFTQSYTDSLSHAAGDPVARWQGVANLTQAAKVPRTVTGDPAAAPGTLAREVADRRNAPGLGTGITADNVFVSARYLNLNGTIRSGRAEQTLTIGAAHETAAGSAAAAYALSLAGLNWRADTYVKTANLATNDYRLFKLPRQAGDTVDVYYNAPFNRYEVAGVEVRGGYTELFGQVLSTGGGRVEVLDGYGKVTVNNTTSRTVVVNELSTGAGIVGKLKVTDLGLPNPNDGRPLTTEYRRDPVTKTVHTESYYAASRTKPREQRSAPADSGLARTTSYSPRANQRYVWSTGQNFVTRRYTNYETSDWAGIDSFAKDGATVTYDHTETLSGIDLLPGAYIETGTTAPADYSYGFATVTTSTPVTSSRTDSSSTWYGTNTYYLYETVTTGYKEIHTHAINASRPITVTFTGGDAGSGNTGVTVTSVGDVVVAGPVRSDGGRASITSDGKITRSGDTAVVGGRGVTLSAGAGIGAAGAAVRTDLVGPGTLTATTGAGPVVIHEAAGPLTASVVGSGGGDVTLSAAGSILTTGGGRIYGGAISLTSAGGSVGTLGTGGTARDPAGDASPVRVDTGTQAGHTLTVSAAQSAYLIELSGDLRVVAVTAGGDARVVVNGGSLLDANTVETRDTRTEQQLQALWERMTATVSTAGQSIAETVAAYEAGKVRDYRAYWQYRNTQATPGVYDPAHRVTLSAAERDFYTSYYTAQGVDPAAAITTLENKRTAEYHTLHVTFGKFGNTFNPNFSYRANQTPAAGAPQVFESFGPAEVNAAGVRLPNHVFTTGQAVVYRARGGSVGGLTDGATYYAVVDPAAPDRVKLAASYDDATAPTPVTIALGAAAGTGQYLSEADALAVRAAWSDSQLRNSVAAGVLRPKGVPGTTFTAEAPNVVGNNVYLLTGAAIGGIDATVEIALPLGGALSDAQKLALSSAERGDITFLGRNPAGQLVVVDPENPAQTVTLLRIRPRQDVDVTAAGVFDAVSAGAAGIGSEAPLAVRLVQAGGEVRIKSQKALTNARAAGDGAANVAGGETVLEAEEETVGTAAKPFVVDLQGTAALTARATGDVHVTEKAGDLFVREVFSLSGHVGLVGPQSIRDAANDDAAPGGADYNVGAVSAALTAGQDVGRAGEVLELDLAGGPLDVAAGRHAYLAEVAGDLRVGLVTAAETVSLAAAGSVVDAGDVDGNGVPLAGNPLADVVAKTVILSAGQLGTVGGPGDDLDIDTTGGTVTTHSGLSAYLTETAGDLRLATVRTDAGTAFLAALSGAILNGNLARVFNVESGKTYLFASGNVGAADNPLRSKVGNLEGKSTTGGVWIENTGAVTVGGVTAGADGVSATGPVTITANSPVTVAEAVFTPALVTITANDHGADGDDILIAAGAKVESSAAAVVLRSGDNVTIEAGGTLTSGVRVEVWLDFASADIGGGSAAVEGEIEAPVIVFNGGAESDVFLFTATAGLTGDVGVAGGGGADLVGLNGLRTRAGAFAVDGQGGPDEVVVNTSGGTQTYTVAVTDTGNDGETDTLTVNGTAGGDDIAFDGNAMAVRAAGSETVLYTPALESVALAGGGGVDFITAAADLDFTLTDLSFGRAGLVTVGLDGVERARLTGGPADNVFTAGGWTGVATLYGMGGRDTLAVTADADFALSADTLRVGDGGRFTLADVERAVLTGGPGANLFDVSGWTGRGAVNGGSGTDTLVARADADFALADDQLTRTGGGRLALSGVDRVLLAGGPGDNTFDVTGYTGRAAVNGGGGTDTVRSRSATRFFHTPESLSAGDGGRFTLTSVEAADLPNALPAAAGGNTLLPTTLAPDTPMPTTNLRPSVLPLEARENPSYLPAAATFEAIDLAAGSPGVVTAVLNTGPTPNDDATAAIDLGANTFRFYGQTVSALTVSANGVLSTGGPLVTDPVSGADAVNTDLTVGNAGKGIIAPLWDDWLKDSADPVMVNYQVQGNRLIVEWESVEHQSLFGGPDSSPVRFQAVLELNTGNRPGDITFLYPDTDANTTGDVTPDGGRSATVGVRAAQEATATGSGGVRTLVSFNAANTLVGDGKAVRLTWQSAAPANTVLTLTPAIDEGGTATLGGTFTDPNTTDTHTVTVDWGDGTAPTVVNLAAGVTSFAGLTHVYADNPAGQPAGSYTVTVTVADLLETGTPATATVQVNNVPVAVVAGADAAIDEAGTFTRDITFTDRAGDGPHTATVDWGTGPVSLGVVTSPFTISRTFADSGPRTVTVRVTDKDGATTAASFVLTVNNVAPAVTGLAAAASSEGAAGTYGLGSFADPGPDAPYSVSVNWGDGSAPTTFTANTPGSLGTAPHTFADDGPFTVTVTVTDKDGGVGTGQFVVTVAGVAPSAVLGGAATADEGATVTFRLTGAADPSPVDLAGLRYSLALTPGGLAATYAAASAKSDQEFPFADEGTYTVYGRVIDPDGLFTDYQTTITVANVAPTVAVPAPVAPASGKAVVLTGTAADVGTTDVLSYAWTVTGPDGRTAATGTDPTVRFTPARPGPYTAKLVVTDGDGGSVTNEQTFTAMSNGLIAVAADGGGPRVKVYRAADGKQLTDFMAFEPTYTGGVRVAVGDVNGDGVPDVAYTAGPGGGPRVTVVSGDDFRTLLDVMAYEESFRGGLNLALADLDGDGKAEVITAPDAGGGPLVKAFNVATGRTVFSRMMYADDFRGGVRVAAGDVNGDGRADIITAAGAGGGPHVKAVDVATGKELLSAFAFAPSDTGGLFVAAADVDGDGKYEVAAGSGVGPAVAVVDLAGNVRSRFFAPGTDPAAFGAGVRVSAVDMDSDGRDEVVTGTGPGAAARVGVWDVAGGKTEAVYSPFEEVFLGGVYVGAGG